MLKAYIKDKINCKIIKKNTEQRNKIIEPESINRRQT